MSRRQQHHNSLPSPCNPHSSIRRSEHTNEQKVWWKISDGHSTLKITSAHCYLKKNQYEFEEAGAEFWNYCETETIQVAPPTRLPSVSSTKTYNVGTAIPTAECCALIYRSPVLAAVALAFLSWGGRRWLCSATTRRALRWLKWVWLWRLAACVARSPTLVIPCAFIVCCGTAVGCGGRPCVSGFYC